MILKPGVYELNDEGKWEYCEDAKPYGSHGIESGGYYQQAHSKMIILRPYHGTEYQ